MNKTPDKRTLKEKEPPVVGLSDRRYLYGKAIQESRLEKQFGKVIML